MKSFERRVGLALVVVCALVVLPLAGNFALWDPWETHYGEIAREMLARHDYVSPWWSGSSVDRPEVFHKPVLHFWLLGISYRLFGLEGAHASPSELVDSWRVEWAERLPNILLGLICVIAIWQLTRRLANVRAATLAGLVLGTATQWALVTRQAMTDLPFVAPMTVALVLVALALLDADDTPLPRARIWRFTFPRAPAFYAFLALFVFTVVPQLIIFSIQVHAQLRVNGRVWHLSGVVPMLPYIAAFPISLYWCTRAKNRRQLYLCSAYALCGVASLAKGPAGVGMPGLVLFFYLILSGKWRAIFKLDIPRGVLIFILVAFPWYHAMHIRHGAAFWNELIGDNYIHRAMGRNGDRGTFEYYLQWAAYGLFPWSGLAAAGGIFAFKGLRESNPRRALAAFALVWFIVDYTIVSLVNTKFHHYILPALPAAAVLAGLFLDELLTAATRAHALGLALIALPITLLCGRDLAAFPARLLWLFNYDYVNMPNTGRPWPSPAVYGDKYDYTSALFLLAAFATFAVGLLAVAARARRASELDPAPAPNKLDSRYFICAFFALLIGFLISPKTDHGAPPILNPRLWLIPTILVLPFAAQLGRALFAPSRAALALGAALVAAVAWCNFVDDKFMLELSPHWGQKHVLAAYYQKRTGPEEPLIAWELYWRGENLYTRNQIYDSPDPNERTVFVPNDRAPEKLAAYLKSHTGRRIFFITERVKLDQLRSLLPPPVRPTLSVVDDSNNKLYLLVAQN